MRASSHPLPTVHHNAGLCKSSAHGPAKSWRQLAWSGSGVCRASKGFGGGGSGSGGRDQHASQDTIKESRQQQLAAADVLAQLLQAEDPRRIAAKLVGSLDEQFFWSASAYLQMAKRENNADVASRLEAVLKAAFEVKQSTLRPEIQLLNRLLGADTQEQRRQVLAAPGTADVLRMDGGYFFQLVDRMAQDVGRQPDGQQQQLLLQKLEAIRQEAGA